MTTRKLHEESCQSPADELILQRESQKSNDILLGRDEC